MDILAINICSSGANESAGRSTSLQWRLRDLLSSWLFSIWRMGKRRFLKIFIFKLNKLGPVHGCRKYYYTCHRWNILVCRGNILGTIRAVTRVKAPIIPRAVGGRGGQNKSEKETNQKNRIQANLSWLFLFFLRKCLCSNVRGIWPWYRVSRRIV